MVTQLPPLGPRGWSPEDLLGLPALPAGFAWGRPYYGGSLVIAGEVAVLVGSDQVAMVSPLVTGAGWLAQVGQHREALKGRHHIWTRTFDRGVDYVVAWLRRYDQQIGLEVDAMRRHRLSTHSNRATP